MIVNKPRLNEAFFTHSLDFRGEKILERAEQKLTVLAIEKISFTELPYDFSYFKNIHQTLFSDIYEWAGEVRTVDISLDSTRFCNCSRIEPEAEKLFDYLTICREGNTSRIFQKTS